MPTYEYACYNCQHTFDRFQKFSEPDLNTCPLCNNENIKRLISTPEFCWVKADPNKNILLRAEANSKRFGNSYISEQDELNRQQKIKAKQKLKENLPPGAELMRDYESTSKPEPPIWRSGEVEGFKKSDKPVDLKGITNVRKFIETGIKE